MDIATRWNFGDDSAETTASQVDAARPVNPTVAISAGPSGDSRVQTALDLAMQELERALELKRKHRARVAELSSYEALRAA